MRQLLWFDRHAQGRPYHAARVHFGPRAPTSGLHGHADFYEFMGVTSGAGEHLRPDGRHLLSAGDIVLVRPRDQHAFAGLSPDGLEFINVAFPATAWRQFLELAGADPSHGWEHQADPVVFSSPEGVAGSAHQAFETALERFYGRPSKLDLVRFWTDVLAVVAQPGDDDSWSAAGRWPVWLTDSCSAMRREENLRGGVARLVDLCNVSPAHLSRTMRVCAGTTPTRFVTGLRLERAASLLATTADSVTSIAHRCGFSSQSYFTRCFRDVYELTPREFRREAQRAFVP
ncbi:helix-turn-helix domain-containing protein [Phytoactinopolyspora mesophila]|uniref:Helix-turn-helix domain-containing protein n=1 Tax=Phytoactinopolyspora mesophila TaxID=2650750 RepID=A0A7K3M770_9ACTN|nr:helix-turn-helix domain-containing protein [Phytoactinopolyspora mesophila]